MPLIETNLLSDEKALTPQVASRDIFKRVRTSDICRLTRQLATLLRAGMPLVHALSALVEQLGDYPLSKILEQVRNDINAGDTYAGALSKFPDIFSPLYVNMIAAGENSGTLEQVLLRLADMLEKRVHLAGKVKAAIAYPVMMMVVATVVVVFLLSFVVPSITQIFIEMNRALPLPTRLLIAVSTFLKTYFILIAILICAALSAVAAWTKTKEGKLLTDHLKLKLPLFGNLYQKLEIARLTRMLGELTTNGIPILAALEMAKAVAQNSFIANSLNSVKDSVSKGDDIAHSIRKTGLFPPIVFHILATGQMSGSVQESLLDIADMYDGEVELTAKALTSLLEPAILLVTGAIIGFIVLAILLPIFEINQVL